MKPGTRFAALFAITIGCSSSNFEVGTTGADTGAVEDVGIDETAATDSGGVDSAQPADSNNTDDAIVAEGGCAFETNPAELWVDATSASKAPTGTATCPFGNVLDAVAYADKLGGNRTIRVRPGKYTEGAAIVLRSGLTLTGSGVGVTQLAGGGNCYDSTTAYKCIVRVEGGGILERVTVDAGPTAKHGIVTGSTSGGSNPIVRSTVVTNAVGDGNAGILATAGATLGPNIEAVGNRFGLVIWSNQAITIVAGTNRFDGNAAIGINHEGTGKLIFQGGSVSNNNIGIKLGEPVPTVVPIHDIKDLTAKNNVEVGIRVTNVASLKLRNSTIIGSKIGVYAVHGTSNFIDLGNTGSLGGNYFGGVTARNSLAGVCAMFTRSPPLDATGNTFPACGSPRSLDDISPSAGCEAITTYADVWYRGGTLPITAGCSVGM